MANIPISLLPNVQPSGYTPNDLLVLVNSGVTKNTSLLDITNYILSGATFTGNTSATCISDLYVTNFHGCSPITIHDSIQSIGSQATGVTSFAFGDNVSAFGDYSHAEGFGTISSGQSSHAEGVNTQSIGNSSHAEGTGTQSIGSVSHAEGRQTQSIGSASHTEGYQTISQGDYSHTEGRGTQAIGGFSHSEGYNTQSIGGYSHAEGLGTVSDGDYQHVSGMYNVTGDTTLGAFIIGNGINSGNRSNLLFAGGNEVNVSGKTITTNFQMTSGATAGYVLTASDSNGNSFWQSLSSIGGLVTGLTFNNGTYDLTVNTNAGDFTQSLYILAGDMTVTGGTYNSGTGTATFTTNSGGTFNVTGFLTGYTDTNIYTVNGTLTGNRTVTMAGNSLNFTEDITIAGIYYGKGQGGPPNIAIGNQTLISNSSGFENVAIGTDSLRTNNVGNNNVGIGYGSLHDNDGDLNIAIGYNSMYTNTNGGGNVAIGQLTLFSNTSGLNNISIGSESLYNNTIGESNVSLGIYSLYYNDNGSFNTALGRESLYNNVDGNYNLALGYNSLVLNYSGNYNVALGASAGANNQTGEYNTYVGAGSGAGIATGSYNTIIGANVSGLTGALSNNVIIADGQGNRRINVDNNGNVGIGTVSPSELLDISGKTKTINFQMTSGATNGYLLTSDASGNASWQPQTYKTLHTHGFNNSTIGNTTGIRYQIFSEVSVLSVTSLTSNPTYPSAARLGVIPKTGVIKSAKISWYITGGSSTQNHILTFRNNTTSTTNTVTTTLQIGPNLSGVAKTYVVSSLNIPVTENDVVFSVIQSPIISGTALTGVYMIVDYIIE